MPLFYLPIVYSHGARFEYAKSRFFYHQQSERYVEEQLSKSISFYSQKGLIEIQHNELAETGQEGVQADIEHLNKNESGSEQPNLSVRDSPSLVWGRPAKSVVERPRGFNSHIPRHLLIRLIFQAIINN